MGNRTRLSKSQQDINFAEWVHALRKTDMLSEESKIVFVEELVRTRHVLIIDMRQFFSDVAQIKNGMDHKYPFGVITRAMPFAVLEAHDDPSSAAQSCDEMGVSWEMHLYPHISTRVQ